MRRSLQPGGFTVVELLVSTSVALLLIMGVNAVFKTTSRTVGAGQSLLRACRDARTFLQIMCADLNDIDPVATPSNPAGDPICFIIQSSHIYAFRNFDDQQGAAFQTIPWEDPSLFPVGGPWLAGNSAPVPLVHFRSHRIDKLGFFARGLFARQTSSNASLFTSPTTSNEAWVLYEHASQPNKAIATNTSNWSWFSPGIPGSQNSFNKNDYNYFAADWMLARVAILLVPTPNPQTDPIYLKDNGGLTPLTSTSVGSQAIASENSPPPSLYESRLDIAQTSIELFGATSRTVYNGTEYNTYNCLWEQTPQYVMPLASYAPGNLNNGQDWWDPMIATRIHASPYLLTPMGTSATAPKLNPYGLATSAPCLIRGCTQFIVEYAGNYYTKDTNFNDGRAQNPQATVLVNKVPTPVNTPIPDPNGTLDYFVDYNGNRRIRWYGFPRLVSLSNTIAPTLANVRVDATYGNPQFNPGAAPNAVIDAVIPLRDVLGSLTPPGVTPTWGSTITNANTGLESGRYANAERFSTTPAFPPSGSNYWQALSPSTDQYTPYVYTAAWGPDSVQPFPKMIRIVICIDDHEGRLSQPQFYEYVFDVQQ